MTTAAGLSLSGGWKCVGMVMSLWCARGLRHPPSPTHSHSHLSPRVPIATHSHAFAFYSKCVVFLCCECCVHSEEINKILDLILKSAGRNQTDETLI